MSDARVWDAAVVGAGPAGALAARELARRGHAVLLIDKAEFPRPKVCGCCLNLSSIATLKRVGLGNLLADAGAVPLNGVTLGAGGRTAAIRLPGGVALSRDRFDVELIDAAVAAGASFWPGTQAKMLPVEAGTTPDYRRLDLERGGDSLSVAARIVVAADGLNGRLTACDGNAPAVAPASRIGAGVHADAVPAFYAAGCIFMAVGPGGYVGVVRLESGRWDFAAAFDADFVRASGSLATAACIVLQQAGFPAVPGLEKLPWRGTPALTRAPRAVAGPRWFAAGDSSGYVEPFTGEGMAWALAGAATLAPLVSEFLRGKLPDAPRRWRREHAARVGSRQGLCRLLAWALRSPVACKLAVQALGVAPVLSSPAVRWLNRPAARPVPQGMFGP